MFVRPEPARHALRTDEGTLPGSRFGPAGAKQHAGMDEHPAVVAVRHGLAGHRHDPEQRVMALQLLGHQATEQGGGVVLGLRRGRR